MLYISTKAEYGLNLLIALAKHSGRLSLRQIAKESKMPYRFLTKIVKSLIKAKLVQAKEGKGGGYQLIKKPSQISIKQILDSLNESLSMVRCLCGQKCFSSRSCKMKKVWSRIKSNIDKELNQLTLADLI